MIRHQFEMTGCTKLGMMDEGQSCIRSICWACKRPVGKCRWIMLGEPYPGSEYWERKCWYDRHINYSVYTITSCPKELR